MRKWGLVKGGGLHAKEHTHQRGQATAQAVTGEGDASAGVGGFDLKVVLGGLQQLVGHDAQSKLDIRLDVATVFVVGASVGNDDFGAVCVFR